MMTTIELHRQLRAWRRREHHHHHLFDRDRRHVRNLLKRLDVRERPRAIRGVDISVYQGRGDMRALRAGGIELMIAKATEGLTFVDPTFAQHMHDAHEAGLIRGAYHFARPQPGRTGEQEAAHFLRVARSHLRKGDLFPCLDIETTQLDRTGTIAFVHDFTRAVHDETGWRTVLYTYPAFLAWPPMPNPLWIAGPGRSSAPTLAGFRPPVIWQNSFTGRVPGIAGNVDTDITDTRTLRTITIGGTRP